MLISGVDDLELDPNRRTEICRHDLHNPGLAYMRILRTNDWELVR
jgi:hypothetical protein